MRKSFAFLFKVLLLLSLMFWVVGMLTAAVVPWFGGVRADRIGQIGVAVFICGEGVVCIFGWLFKRFTEEPSKGTLGLLGPKRYGNKKHCSKLLSGGRGSSPAE